MSHRPSKLPERAVPRAGLAIFFVLLASLTGSSLATSLTTGAQRGASWPTEQPPRPLPARPVKFPPYEVRTLSNGLQVVAVSHHEQPAISARILIRAGSAQDPSGTPGVAGLVAALLDQGTTTKTAQQIAETIDSVGGGLGTGAGTDLSYGNVVVMKDSFDLGLSLLSDIMRNPSFRPEEIERQRQQMLSGLQVSYGDADFVANVVFDRLVYGFHPYGAPGGGTPGSVAQMTRDHLTAFHSRYFVPNNALMAIVGDINAKEAFDGAERHFGSWARRELVAQSFTPPPEPTRRVLVIDKPDAVQTEIRVGQLGIPRKHPDYMALNLAIKVLGGEGSNRLHRVLRSDRGLTYGAQADMDTLKQSGDIVAETDTRSERTAEVLRLMVEQFWLLQREPVSEAELADAKAYLAGSFPLTIETPESIATQVLNVLFYELGLDELQTFRERVNAVTSDDLQRVAQKYLKSDRLSVVLVGNAQAFEKELRGLGFSQYERVPLADLDPLSADFKRQVGVAGNPSARPSAAQAQTATESLAGPTQEFSNKDASAAEAIAILKRVVDAKGGLDRLKNVKTLVAQASTTLVTPQGPVDAETTTSIHYPGRFRVDAKLPMGEFVQTYADGHAWTKDPGGVHDAPAAVVEDFRSSVNRDLIPLLVESMAGNHRVRLLPGDITASPSKLHAVEVSGPHFGTVTLFIDATSFLVTRQTYSVSSPSGPDQAEELFSEYRTVDGIQVAFKAVVKRGGKITLERTLKNLQFNVPIDPDRFKKPA